MNKIITTLTPLYNLLDLQSRIGESDKLFDCSWRHISLVQCPYRRQPLCAVYWQFYVTLWHCHLLPLDEAIAFRAVFVLLVSGFDGWADRQKRFWSWLNSSKTVRDRPYVHLSHPDTMTITVLEAIASPSGKNKVNILCSGSMPHWAVCWLWFFPASPRDFMLILVIKQFSFLQLTVTHIKLWLHVQFLQLRPAEG